MTRLKMGREELRILPRKDMASVMKDKKLRKDYKFLALSIIYLLFKTKISAFS